MSIYLTKKDKLDKIKILTTTRNFIKLKKKQTNKNLEMRKIELNDNCYLSLSLSNDKL